MRRNDVKLMDPVELSIRDCIQEVEKMSADPRLTEAVILLGKAQEKVADFLDGIHG